MNNEQEPTEPLRAPSGSASWATDLVSSWCSKRADDLTPLIVSLRNAYRTGPMVVPVNQFADILEHQQSEWREHALAFAITPGKAASTKVEEPHWIGHPMVSNNDPYTPSQAWLPQYQIGFRSDGVVVWRKLTNAPTAK